MDPRAQPRARRVRNQFEGALRDVLNASRTQPDDPNYGLVSDI
jgi:hypothetical protein